MGLSDELGDLKREELATLLAQIGNTPIRRVRFDLEGVGRDVFIKLEGANPGGSVKDRTAYGLVQDLKAKGLLKKDSILIDSTSGNLGVALAFIAKSLGYEFVAVVDPKTTKENRLKMERLGARIEAVDVADSTGGYLLTRLERVRELCNSSPRYVWTNQYSNPGNPRAHYFHTGPEIMRQMDGRVDVVFAAVSTGGTMAGIGRFFRERSPNTRIVAVDAKGSVVFGGSPGPRKLTGIGSSRKSDFLSMDLIDEHVIVGDIEAFALCRELHAATGIKVGGSSGAVLSACAQYLCRDPEPRRVVCLSADDGGNYQSSIFSDTWLAENGFGDWASHLGALRHIELPAIGRRSLTAA